MIDSAIIMSNDEPVVVNGCGNGSTYAPEPEIAISLCQVFKGYGFPKNRNNILKGIDMTVPRGNIYCILGPSGCGKTTLLRCVLGLQKIDSGFIHVFGHNPGCPETHIPGPGVGYMPQNVSLYDELTIKENALYYGCLVGLSPEEINSRTDFMLELLDLPSSNKKKCGQLSGGQKRRVSFATSVMHEPRLLILDEPTVGMDPPIRKKVWDYLELLTKRDGVTVIVITHYLEEARSADTVGLMIDGVFLAEDPPEKLIFDSKCDNLEDVFLQLCLNRTNAIEDSDTITAKLLPNEHVNDVIARPSEIQNGHHLSLASAKSKTDDNKKGYPQNDRETPMCPQCNKSKLFSSFLFAFPSISKTKAVVKKSFYRSCHDPANLCIQLLLPVVVASLFSLTMGMPIPGLRLGVVDQDRDAVSQSYRSSLKSLDLDLVPFDTYEEAYSSVEIGNTWGIIYFPENLTNNMMSRYLYASYAEPHEIENSNIHVTLDLSNQIVTHVLNDKLYEGYKKCKNTILTAMGVNTDMGDFPIKITNAETGWLKSTQSSMAPGMSMCAMFFMSMTLTAVSFLVERKDGQLERSLVAGLKPMEIVAAVSLFQALVSFVEMLILYVLVVYVFGYVCRGSHLILMLVVTLQGLCGMGFGLAISSVCDNLGNAGMLIMGTFLPICVISGIIWPIKGMPYILQVLASCLPPTIPSEGLRGVFSRGWTITEPPVYLGCIVPLAWFIGFVPLTVLFFRLKLKCAY